MKPRIAFYARYSSDLQNEKSIDQQIGLLRREIVARFGVADPVAIFTDEAVSGATMRREGLSALVESAEFGRFDLLVMESLDRLSRSLQDGAQLFAILEHLGIKIWTPQEGEIGEIQIGFRGTMNALFLKDLKNKVKRSHVALVEEGRAVSSVPYGYRAVRGVIDHKGRYVNGLREIEPTEAAVVKRIYEEIAAGLSLGAIVRSLNADGIPAPAGGLWKKHTLRGERNRGKGILNNEIYNGWLVYNRTHKVVDPRTGRRRYMPNLPKDWIRTPVPNLKIISDELWQKVQNAKPAPSARVLKKAGRKRNPDAGITCNGRPLTGLVICGWCGGGKQIANSKRYVCNTYRYHSGLCKNARGLREGAIAKQVFAALELSAEAVMWQEKVRQQIKQDNQHWAEQEKQLETLQKRMDRLINCIERGIREDSATEKALELQDHIRQIKAHRPEMSDLSDGEMTRRVQSALRVMFDEFENTKYQRPLGKLLSLVVDKIVLTPIKEQRSGETVRVKVKPSGWPDFYRAIHAGWPRIGRGG